jgi:Contractile injection system tube protein
MGLNHAVLRNEDTGDEFEVLFNPAEYSLSKDNVIAQASAFGSGSPLLQFVNGNVKTLEMELFFDTYERHAHVDVDPLSDVRSLTGKVTALMEINPATHAPPLVTFTWGELAFTGVLVRANQRFTMFVDSGVPVRAQLQVSFQEYKEPLDEAKEVKRETADHTRRHEVGDGQTLSAIAWSVYRDPGKWRPLAIANDLVEVRRLQPGSVLDVPALPYRDPATGDVYT